MPLKETVHWKNEARFPDVKTKIENESRVNFNKRTMYIFSFVLLFSKYGADLIG